MSRRLASFANSGARACFEGVSVTSADGLSFSYDDRAERVQGEVVSGNYFDVLGVRPIIGQPFTSEVRSGHWAAEAVLCYSFWQRRFGGDPGVIGRTIRLNTYPFTIAGVSPPGFLGLGRGTDIDVRIPILPDGRELAQIARIGARHDRNLITIARLKPDSSLVQAEVSADVQFQGVFARHNEPAVQGQGYSARQAGCGRKRRQRHSPSVAHAALHSVRAGGARAADRLRECRQHAPGPGSGAGARVGGATRRSARAVFA